jgi:hypothetical protein
MAKSDAISADLETNCSSIESNKPGAYVVEEAEIDYGGHKHGISIYLREIHIFENIDTFGITGWVEMLDTDNLVSGFISGSIPAKTKHAAIVGQELLYLKFRTLGSKFPVDFFKHPLQIHKIENLQEMETETEAKSGLTYTYRLHFCSPEMLRNDRIRISQTYEGTYSDIVKDILTTHLKTRKRIYIQDTTDIHRILIPNMHPYDAINMLIKDSIETNKMPNFNFYETTKGFKFKTLVGNPGDTTSDSQVKITFGPTIQDGNYQRMMRVALDYQFIQTGDTFESIKKGMFASKHIEHDAFNKIYKVDDVGYHDDLPLNSSSSKYKHFVTTGKVYDPTGTVSANISEFPDSRLYVSSTNTKRMFDYVDVNGKISTADADGTSSLVVPSPKQKMLRTMQKNHDEYIKLGLTIHGMSGLQVGDKIQLSTLTLGAGHNKGEGKTDARWSDFYYITELSHNINLRAGVALYTCNLVCTQQSYDVATLPDRGKLTGTETKETIGSFQGIEERDEDTHPSL